MFKLSRQGTYLFVFILSIALLYLLSSILTPFLLGGLLAYLANPAVKKLDSYRLPHIFSVMAIFLIVLFGILILLLMLIPIVEKQIILLIQLTPGMIDWVQQTLFPWLMTYLNVDNLKSSLSFTLSKSSWILNAVLKSGYMIIIWIANLVLTPVVTFYLLRDYDKIIRVIVNIIPADSRELWIAFASSCDDVLSAFFRGQLMVMLSLAFIYAIGLTIAGLQVGFVVGFIGGILSIIPYLGSIFVLLTSILTAIVQTGNMDLMLWIVLVFLIGQLLEGYVLTPYFVGNKIGLHPVVVIFAILAGGVLFGAVGVLLALPVTAVIKVALHYAR